MNIDCFLVIITILGFFITIFSAYSVYRYIKFEREIKNYMRKKVFSEENQRPKIEIEDINDLKRQMNIVNTSLRKAHKNINISTLHRRRKTYFLKKWPNFLRKWPNLKSENQDQA